MCLIIDYGNANPINSISINKIKLWSSIICQIFKHIFSASTVQKFNTLWSLWNACHHISQHLAIRSVTPFKITISIANLETFNGTTVQCLIRGEVWAKAMLSKTTRSFMHILMLYTNEKCLWGSGFPALFPLSSLFHTLFTSMTHW